MHPRSPVLSPGHQALDLSAVFVSIQIHSSSFLDYAKASFTAAAVLHISSKVLYRAEGAKRICELGVSSTFTSAPAKPTYQIWRPLINNDPCLLERLKDFHQRFGVGDAVSLVLIPFTREEENREASCSILGLRRRDDSETSCAVAHDGRRSEEGFEVAGEEGRLGRDVGHDCAERGRGGDWRVAAEGRDRTKDVHTCVYGYGGEQRRIVERKAGRAEPRFERDGRAETTGELVAPPSCQAKSVEVTLVNEDACGSAGTRAKVLVVAPHGEVDVPVVELEESVSCGVCAVPSYDTALQKVEAEVRVVSQDPCESVERKFGAPSPAPSS